MKFLLQVSKLLPRLSEQNGEIEQLATLRAIERIMAREELDWHGASAILRDFVTSVADVADEPEPAPAPAETVRPTQPATPSWPPTAAPVGMRAARPSGFNPGAAPPPPPQTGPRLDPRFNAGPAAQLLLVRDLIRQQKWRNKREQMALRRLESSLDLGLSVQNIDLDILRVLATS